MANTIIVISWIAQILVALLLVMPMMMKFMGKKEVKKLFKKLGVGSGMRYFVGLWELAIIVLILIPATIIWGAGLGFIMGFVASLLHITKLGISVNNDKGMMFMMALAITILSGFVFYVRFF